MCLTYRKSIEEVNTISRCYDTITHSSLFNTHQHHYIDFLMPNFVCKDLFLSLHGYICMCGCLQNPKEGVRSPKARVLIVI